MNKLSQILFGIILVSIISCKSGQITADKNMEEKVLWINSAKVPCTGVGPMSCLQIQESEEIEEGQWKNFFSAIEGFDYKPGSIFKIKVKVEQLPPPIPADASSMKYTLIEVISENADRTLRITAIWKVENIGELQNPTGMGKSLTLEMNASGRSIFGFSGCNTLRGPIVKLTETEIEFGNLMSTMMACPQADMALERSVSQALHNTKKYSIENRRLTLSDSVGNKLMVLLNVD